MDRLTHTTHRLALRKKRIRSVVSGTGDRPRLTVYVSNKHISAQIIDDTERRTLVYVTTVGQKNPGQTMTERAAWVGKEIATKAKAGKIKRVVFDRNGRLYHGRIKTLATAAREQGLEF
jgi:large subunit ribosomal protein L18